MQAIKAYRLQVLQGMFQLILHTRPVYCGTPRWQHKYSMEIQRGKNDGSAIIMEKKSHKALFQKGDRDWSLP